MRPAQQITRQIRAIGIYRTMPIIRLHPRSGRQKVLAKASNKRPHFPQWPLLFGLFLLLCFFSGSPLVTRLANGKFTSSPAWISKGLQSSPTKVVFMHNLGCLNLDTSTKWIFLSKPTRSFGVIATHCATFMVTLHLTPTRWWRRSRARYWVKLWLLLSLRSLLRMVVVVFTKGHLAFIPPGYHDQRPWWWWWLEYRKDDFLIRWNEIFNSLVA